MTTLYIPTEAERHFDALIRERRAKGRNTYGQGLTHTDAYDWNVMALEEALDLAQYLAAENLKIRQAAEAFRAHVALIVTWPSVVQPVGIIEEELRRQQNAMADRISNMKLPWESKS